MGINNLCEKLSDSLKANFDIQMNKTINNKKFDLVAEYNIRTSKYAITKQSEIYAFKNYEYVLLNDVNGVISKNYLDSILKFLQNNIDDIVQRDDEFMSSTITFLISGTSELDDETERSLKKLKFYKSYAFGFKGWVNAKFIYINKNNGQIITNKFGKSEIKKLNQILS